MKSIIHEDFLLTNKFSQRLYHDYAKNQPIIDYHCHLPPDEIATNKRFDNITQVWINGDHYKWRAMRTLGIEEKYITGSASDREKFEKWALTVPYTLRNPLYHWTHLELYRYFGIDQPLNPDTSGQVFDKTMEMLQHPDLSTQGMMRNMNVEVVCTTDDPTDDLQHHMAMQNDDFEISVRPTFRPDKVFSIGSGEFTSYIDNLSVKAKTEINDLDGLFTALEKRVEFFHQNGCRLSDHGLQNIFGADFRLNDVNQTFGKALNGSKLSPEEEAAYQAAVLHQLSTLYHKYGWAQQFHLGALRNNNDRMIREIGPDTGFDSIGDFPQAQNLSRFFNRLDSSNHLPKTILYNLNPADNEVFATMVGNYNDGSIKGKVQFGSGWWFLDQKDGMKRQMNALSNMGLISCFIGMLTDSRSFLSYPRHEYFRRVLCNLFGQDIERGELPEDMDWIGKIIADISYFNAREYFDFNE
ncbi:MAG TPA: glucuronate isomerase [Cytophagales bacterium]|nr:glucuronate isomerase [Cytophagales bacterium]